MRRPSHPALGKRIAAQATFGEPQPYSSPPVPDVRADAAVITGRSHVIHGADGDQLMLQGRTQGEVQLGIVSVDIVFA